MKIGITGATGFIGSQLTEHLIQEGHHVTCLIRRTSDTRWLNGLPVEFRYGEILDEESLGDFVKDKEIIFHCAGTARGRTDEEIMKANRTGTENICTAVGKFNRGLRRFVYLSSQEAAGLIPGDEPADEDTPLNPVTAYGASKAAAEEIIRSCSGLPFTIIRPSPVFGPRDRDILIMFKLIYRNFFPLPKLHGRISLVYSRNLVRGILHCGASEKTLNETYYLADDGYFSWEEISGLIARSLDRKPLRIPIPLPVIKMMGAVSTCYSRATNRATILSREKFMMMGHPNLTVSNEKAKQDFGYTSEVPVERALEETAVWYREHGWL